MKNNCVLLGKKVYLNYKTTRISMNRINKRLNLTNKFSLTKKFQMIKELVLGGHKMQFQKF